MARQLRQAGWANARALEGGWHAWREAALPTEPKAQPALPGIAEATTPKATLHD